MLLISLQYTSHTTPGYALIKICKLNKVELGQYLVGRPPRKIQCAEQNGYDDSIGGTLSSAEIQ